MFPLQAIQTQSSHCPSHQQARPDSSLGIWSRCIQQFRKSWKKPQTAFSPVLVYPCYHLLIRDPGPRWKHHNSWPGETKKCGCSKGKVEERTNIRGCSTGRQTETGQDLHIRAHWHLGICTYCCCSLCPCPGGQQRPHLEGHAGGFRIRNVPPEDPMVIEWPSVSGCDDLNPWPSPGWARLVDQCPWTQVQP